MAQVENLIKKSKVVAVGFLVLSFGACGGSSESRVSGSPTPTEETATPSATVSVTASPPASLNVAPTPTNKPEPSLKFTNCPPWGDPVQPPPGMEVRLELLKRTFVQGEVAKMTIVATNHSDSTIRNERPSTQAYDFWVIRGTDVLWLATWGASFGAMVREEEFSPGEEKSHSYAWDQQLCQTSEGKSRSKGGGPPPPGTYEVRGLWSTRGGGWWTEPVQIEVRPA